MLIKKYGELYSDALDVKIYQVGKDFSYIKNYGILTKGTLIIDKKKKYDRLSKSMIEEIIKKLI